jgi:kynureninase
LGLKRTKYVDEVMDDWANLAVEGHFMLKTMVGLSRAFCCKLAKMRCIAIEITVMNTLTIFIY